MTHIFSTVFLVIGGLLVAGCGEIVPAISEAKDLPKGIPSVPNQTVITGPSSRTSTFLAGDNTQKQDFLFVFDDSGSMTGEVITVQSQLSQFFSALNARRNVDYRVAVTTTNAWLDQGRLYAGSGGESILTPGTSGVVAQFSSILDQIKTNIMNANSRPNSAYEMGWLSTELAIGNYGSSLLRDGVPLAVVILTDATDTSRHCAVNSRGNVQCDAAPYSIDHFVEFFKNLKTQNQVPVKTLLYPLAARYGSECNTLEDDQADWAGLGNRYYEVQRQIGTGFMGSICDGLLANYLTEIGRRISNRGICYDLAKGASRIVDVTVGSRTIGANDQGYQFDSTTGSVCFAGEYQPNAGQTITVNYEIQ